MFTIPCATCGATHLYGPRRITRLANTDDGIEVAVRCFCGAEATTRTGRGAPVAAAASTGAGDLVSSAA